MASKTAEPDVVFGGTTISRPMQGLAVIGAFIIGCLAMLLLSAGLDVRPLL